VAVCLRGQSREKQGAKHGNTEQLNLSHILLLFFFYQEKISGEGLCLQKGRGQVQAAISLRKIHSSWRRKRNIFAIFDTDERLFTGRHWPDSG